MRLTASSVLRAELPPGKTDHIFWDDQIKYLGLRLRLGGSRVVIFQYDRGGKTRKITFGDAAALISPKSARLPRATTIA